MLARDLPPREKICEFVGAHFDFIASHPAYPRMVQREMMRAGRQGSPHIKRIVERYLRPTFARVREVMLEGIARGEIRKVDPMDVVPSLIALNIFYFSAVPMMRLLTPGIGSAVAQASGATARGGAGLRLRRPVSPGRRHGGEPMKSGRVSDSSSW